MIVRLAGPFAVCAAAFFATLSPTSAQPDAETRAASRSIEAISIAELAELARRVVVNETPADVELLIGDDGAAFLTLTDPSSGFQTYAVGVGAPGADRERYEALQYFAVLGPLAPTDEGFVNRFNAAEKHAKMFVEDDRAVVAVEPLIAGGVSEANLLFHFKALFRAVDQVGEAVAARRSVEFAPASESGSPSEISFAPPTAFAPRPVKRYEAWGAPPRAETAPKLTPTAADWSVVRARLKAARSAR